MIQWTTPTLIVWLNTGLLEGTQCEVYGTFSQGCESLTVRPQKVESDTENNRTRLEFTISQLQTGAFRPGALMLQINFVDWMGYRDATKIERLYLGTNLLGKELHNARNIHGYQPGHGNVAAI